MKINKLYSLRIRLKYQYYKLYWKIFPPKRTVSGFYGWREDNYEVLDQKAVCFGVLKE